MTDTAQDPCRVMAETIYNLTCGPGESYHVVKSHDDAISLIAIAIRDHTVYPEMVEFISKIAFGDIEDMIERKSELAEEAKPLLAKAGRK